MSKEKSPRVSATLKKDAMAGLEFLAEKSGKKMPELLREAVDMLLVAKSYEAQGCTIGGWKHNDWHGQHPSLSLYKFSDAVR